jgi:shikimate dehydrogenase
MLSMIDHTHLDLRGVSVTMPHKEHLVRLAREEWEAGDGRWSQDILSQRCGSANTLVIDRSPKGEATQLRVANTDGPAVAEQLAEAGEVLVIGVGGTARAVATELLHRGKRVFLTNRHLQSAQALAERLAAATSAPAPEVVTLEQAADHPIDALVNATPVGMEGGAASGQSSVTPEQLRNLRSLRLVVDCVYRPARTPLLEAAKTAGLQTIDGLAVFVSQAAEQFRLWTGRQAPRQLFDRIAREA